MENPHPRHRARCRKAPDFPAQRRLSRIAARRQRDGDRGLVVPAEIERRQFAIARGEQRRQEIGFEAWQQRLALGVAEADIEFDQLRTLRGQHQPGEEDAAKRRAAAGERRQRRADDACHRRLLDLGRECRRRRIGAHAAGIGPGVAVADALVILRRAEENRFLAICEREQRDFLADQTFLDHHPRAGGAELARLHEIGDRRLGLGHVGRHHHPLAGGEAIGLDHDRRAMPVEIGAGGGGIVEACPGGGRDGGLPGDFLGEGFRAFQPRRRGTRAAAANAARGEEIGDPGDQRRFRARHHEIDPGRDGERDQGVDVIGLDRQVFGDFRGSGIARRAPEFFDHRARCETP